jgi:hypothetical protein
LLVWHKEPKKSELAKIVKYLEKGYLWRLTFVEAHLLLKEVYLLK